MRKCYFCRPRARAASPFSPLSTVQPRRAVDTWVHTYTWVHKRDRKMPQNGEHIAYTLTRILCNVLQRVRGACLPIDPWVSPFAIVVPWPNDIGCKQSAFVQVLFNARACSFLVRTEHICSRVTCNVCPVVVRVDSSRCLRQLSCKVDSGE